MKESIIHDVEVRFVDELGNPILQATILDLSFYLGCALHDDADKFPDESSESIDYLHRYKRILPGFNAEFNCNLTIGKFYRIVTELQKSFDELKKNMSRTGELQQPTT